LINKIDNFLIRNFSLLLFFCILVIACFLTKLDFYLYYYLAVPILLLKLNQRFTDCYKFISINAIISSFILEFSSSAYYLNHLTIPILKKLEFGFFIQNLFFMCFIFWASKLSSLQKLDKKKYTYILIVSLFLLIIYESLDYFFGINNSTLSKQLIETFNIESNNFFKNVLYAPFLVLIVYSISFIKTNKVNIFLVYFFTLFVLFIFNDLHADNEIWSVRRLLIINIPLFIITLKTFDESIKSSHLLFIILSNVFILYYFNLYNFSTNPNHLKNINNLISKSNYYGLPVFFNHEPYGYISAIGSIYRSKSPNSFFNITLDDIEKNFEYKKILFISSYRLIENIDFDIDDCFSFRYQYFSFNSIRDFKHNYDKRYIDNLEYHGCVLSLK